MSNLLKTKEVHLSIGVIGFWTLSADVLDLFYIIVDK